jgi:hypothetical protein
MYASTLVALTSLLSIFSAQNATCPPDTPKSIAIRFAWKHRWLRCENGDEGACPKNLGDPYDKPAKDNCEKYLREEGEDFIIDYYFCQKKKKFDELKPILDKKGWACEISE